MLTTLIAASLSFQGTLAISVDTNGYVGPISPYIYGDNQPDWAGRSRRMTYWRWGGNRITAYNWENNASNAGSDWYHQNDDIMGGGDMPLEAVRKSLADAFTAGAASLISVPAAGHVAADKLGGGDVNQTPDYLNVRFRQSLPAKNSKFTEMPDLSDGKVYQDEFIWALQRKFPGEHPPLWFCIDNEPDLWAYTHARIVPTPPTYASIRALSLAYAEAIKNVAPKSLVFGPASYGWNGYTTFQNATDANGRFFLDFYLQEFRKHDISRNKRYLDALDIHWYPEARGGGKRITDQGSESGLYEARIQAPRSLYDPNYKEDSWIANDSVHGPINLLPLLQGKIAENYPGTKLAINEWNYGGGDHISGGLAVADVLGAMGKYGVFAAAYWHLNGDESYAYGGFDVFTNFDGAGGKFGDIALPANHTSPEKISVYASRSSADPSRITLVAINKVNAATSVKISLAGVTTASGIKAYRLAAGNSAPVAASAPVFSAGGFTMNLPARSATTITFRR